MADNQKYTAEEKARHAARVKEREARKKERQKQKKALTKQASIAPPTTNGGHKTYDASLLKRARNVGGPPYEAFLKYLPHDCADSASVSEPFRTSSCPRRGRTRVYASREGVSQRRHGAAGDAVLCWVWAAGEGASHPERPGHGKSHKRLRDVRRRARLTKCITKGRS